MDITCDQCKKIFTASEEQNSFILNSKRKGMKFIMLECPCCYAGFSLNPQTMEIPPATVKMPEDGLRCPCSSCYGLISYVDNQAPFWGCGECGTVWFSKADLFETIKDSIKKYPYRAEVYTKKGNIFIPVEAQNEPRNYEENVAKE